MPRLAENLPADTDSAPPLRVFDDAEFDAPTASAPRAAGRGAEVWNFVVLAAYQVLMRVGWIFKTETILMPACLTAMNAPPQLLAWQPVLMRIGLSVPPLLYATKLKRTARKKRSVAVTTLGMAAVFGLLSAVWLSGVWGEPGAPRWWLPYLFLALYGLFHCLTGLNQIGGHTLQGKLVRPDRRGRLFAASVLVGSPVAIGAAWWLLPGWLAMPSGGFGWIFAAVAVIFVVAAGSVLFARERPDDYQDESTTPWQEFQSAWAIVRGDANCRRLSVVAVLMSANFMLFPYYQSLGQEEFDQPLSAVMLWVCVQNAATGVFSLVAGPLADRLGNRAALRLAVAGLALTPATTLAFYLMPPESVEPWFWLIFVPLGLTPVSLRFLINYTLEISAAEDHPRYVSAIGMCLASPVIVGSPFVGLLVAWLGCVPIMLVGMIVLLTAGLRTGGLIEPRTAPPGAGTPARSAPGQ